MDYYNYRRTHQDSGQAHLSKNLINFKESDKKKVKIWRFWFLKLQLAKEKS